MAGISQTFRFVVLEVVYTDTNVTCHSGSSLAYGTFLLEMKLTEMPVGHPHCFAGTEP